MIIFYHIPKTGGTNLVFALQNNYPDCRIKDRFTMVRKSDGEVLARWGHFSFEHINQHTPVFVMLRDPVERVISHYWENKRSGYLKCSLDDLVNGKHENNTRLYDFWENYYCWCFTENCIIKTYDRKPMEEDLNEAILNLQTKQLNYRGRSAPLYFGITERFQESLEYFASIAGWESTEYIEKDSKRAYYPRRRTQVSPEVEQKIRDLNQLDMRLYEWAKEEFNNRIK